MRRRDDPADVLPLSTGVFHILLALASGDCHGYAISKALEASTRGTVTLGPTTLYRYLRQLENDGWIVEVPGTASEDPRRRSYRLTPRGRRIAEAEALRLAETVRLAKTLNLLPAALRV
jgi:DNA-binding PadR family transcriptional regulator